jgi:excisionase family DNA binding protein
MAAERVALSIAEAAAALGVSKPTVYTLIKRPGFPVFRVGGRQLISSDGLRDWVQRQVEVNNE